MNKILLPSFTKKGVDLANASKFQLLLFGYRLWVTSNLISKLLGISLIYLFRPENPIA